MDMTVILTPLAKMAIMILLGYVGVKTKYIDISLKDSLSKLILRYAIPLLSLTSISGQILSGDMMQNAGFVILISAIYFFVSLFLGLLMGKMCRMDAAKSAVHACALAVPSIAFIGYPLIQSLYGDAGFFYAVMVVLAFDVLFYGVGVYSIAQAVGGSTKAALKKLINPITVSVFVGLFMLAFGLHLPTVVHDSLNTIGKMLSPLAMLFIGISLAETDFKSLFKRWTLLLLVPIKMIILPVLLAFVLLKLGADDLVVCVLPLILGLPSVSTLAAVAHDFGAPSSYATESVFITTLSCLLSLPIVYFMVQTMLS